MVILTSNIKYEQRCQNRKQYFIDRTYERDVIFICPCIVIITNYNQQDATFLEFVYFTDAPHVSGGSSAHHREHITVHTASDIVNQYYC